MSDTRIGFVLDEKMADLTKRKLAAMLVDNKDTYKRVQEAIKKQLRKARSKVSKATKAALPNDPRQAFRAIRYVVYRRIIGGHINILARRKAGKTKEWKPERKLDQNPKQRGGNRMPRSADTIRMDNYFGADRGFILRFLNTGVNKERKTDRGAERGRIGRRPFFAAAAETAVEEAGVEVLKEIDKIVSEAFEKT